MKVPGRTNIAFLIKEELFELEKKKYLNNQTEYYDKF